MHPKVPGNYVLRSLRHQDYRCKRHNFTAYRDGHLVPQDHEQAFQWFRKAAELGEATGMFCLTQCYEYGWGVPTNAAEAARWKTNAAELGESNALKWQESQKPWEWLKSIFK